MIEIKEMKSTDQEHLRVPNPNVVVLEEIAEEEYFIQDNEPFNQESINDQDQILESIQMEESSSYFGILMNKKIMTMHNKTMLFKPGIKKINSSPRINQKRKKKKVMLQNQQNNNQL
jgi:hypothetical protein